MKLLLLLIINVFLLQAQEYTLTPDGTYVSGDGFTLTPDGTYIETEPYTNDEIYSEETED